MVVKNQAPRFKRTYLYVVFMCVHVGVLGHAHWYTERAHAYVRSCGARYAVLQADYAFLRQHHKQCKRWACRRDATGDEQAHALILQGRGRARLARDLHTLARLADLHDITFTLNQGVQAQAEEDLLKVHYAAEHDGQAATFIELCLRSVASSTALEHFSLTRAVFEQGDGLVAEGIEGTLVLKLPRGAARRSSRARAPRRHQKARDTYAS
jgi:hypothetical protein